MSKDWSARDAIGNKLQQGDLVAFASPTPILCKIVSIEEGGLSTPQGIVPTKVRILMDVTLGTGPGQPIGAVIKAVSPVSELILNDAMGRIKV